jgi:hypothetical protein
LSWICPLELGPDLRGRRRTAGRSTAERSDDPVRGPSWQRNPAGVLGARPGAAADVLKDDELRARPVARRSQPASRLDAERLLALLDELGRAP